MAGLPSASAISSLAADASRCSLDWHRYHAIQNNTNSSEFSWPPPSPKRKRAWVTLLTNQAYAAGVRALLHSLLEQESDYPLVVMATPGVPDAVLNDLSERGCEVRRVPLLPTPTGTGGAAKYAAPHFAECWSKLRVWELDDEFEQIALIDADMVVVRSIDKLLDDNLLPPPPSRTDRGDAALEVEAACRIRAVHECFCVVKRGESECAYLCAKCGSNGNGTSTSQQPLTPHSGSYFNSGLIVLRPSKCVYRYMMDALSMSDIAKLTFPDQDFLNAFFKGCWDALPWVYNATKGLYACHRHDVWDLNAVRNIHFTMAKPWDLTSPLHKGFERLNTIWHAAFSEPRTLCRVLLKAHLLEKKEREAAAAANGGEPAT